MEAHNFFLTLAVLLLAARFLSELAICIGVPAVIGELVAGLIIGPSLLGLVSHALFGMSLLSSLFIGGTLTRHQYRHYRARADRSAPPQQ